MTARRTDLPFKRRDLLVAAIRGAEPKGITARDLTPLVYADVNGGPLSATQCIHVLAHRLRRDKIIVSVGSTWRAVYRMRAAYEAEQKMIVEAEQERIAA